MNYYLYEFYHIDYDWDMVEELENYLKRADENSTICSNCKYRCASCNKRVDVLSKQWSAISAFARKHGGWDGEYSEKPRIGFIPNGCGGAGFSAYYVWKQSNNGTCFIVTPERFDWLIDGVSTILKFDTKNPESFEKVYGRS